MVGQAPRAAQGAHPLTRRAAGAAFLLSLLPLAACAGQSASGAGASAAAAKPAPPEVYRILTAAESDDQVSLIECSFKPSQPSQPSQPSPCRVTRTYPVGLIPSDVEGPHGVVASPSGRVMYVSLAHGRPNGLLQKYSMDSGRLIAQVELGMFPATVDISADGAAVWVVNFNFDDPVMRPSSVSVVDAGTMLELARIETCRMPHGSRLSPDGSKHYSGCMMDDLLVEIDARTREVGRLLNVATGAAVSVSTLRDGPAGESAASHEAHAPTCSPTWAQPSADGAKVYVACTKSAEIVEVDAADWKVIRRWPTPKTPYNLAVTPDGRLLVATQKGPGSTTVWRISDAKLLAEIPGTRSVASGVAVSGDGRYAFVSLEGKGGDPGTLDVIDLERLEKIASVATGKQAGGVAVMP